jgi:hypothetical protein
MQPSQFSWPYAPIKKVLTLGPFLARHLEKMSLMRGYSCEFGPHFQIDLKRKRLGLS